MIDHNFIVALFDHLLEGVKMPKVQVERSVTPILGMFIGSILDALTRRKDEEQGRNVLVSPEFPLKKKNNQSTNIDFLLVNNSEDSIVLVEIKTDIKSFDFEQLEVYSGIKEKVKSQSVEILRDDLNKIKMSSNRPEKYDYIISRFDESVSSAHRIRKIDLIYIVPKALKNQIGDNMAIDHLLCFEDLPDTIDHKYAEYWSIIRSKLLLLDEYFKPRNYQIAYGDPMKVIVKNIKQYLSIYGHSLKPDYIEIGKTGEGNKPNYQVTFTNGSKKAFYFSGKEHQAKVFHNKHLGPGQSWIEILEIEEYKIAK